MSLLLGRDRSCQMWPQNRIPTVHDLKVRRCFICLDDDSSRGRNHGFVHACNCTLVAHEQCLLAWTCSGGPERFKCAQCGAPYSIVQRTPFVLRILDAGQRVVERAGGLVFMGTAACVHLSFVGLCYLGTISYGCYAARFMLGWQLFAHALNPSEPSKWSPHAWAVLPVVPVAFWWASAEQTPLLSIEIIHAVGVWIVCQTPIRPLVTLPGQSPPTLGILFKRTFLDWPPSPLIISVLFPMISMPYVALRNALARRLDLPPHIIGHMPHEHGRRDADRRAAQGYTVGSMLLLPPCAGWVGGMLRRLGMALGSDSWVGRFICVGEPKQGWWRILFSPMIQKTWGDFEPVWWHSLLGIAIITISRDALSLTMKCLRQRQTMKSLRIDDLPFEGVNLDALDLRQ